jgi:propane monooxygenase small subunit
MEDSEAMAVEIESQRWTPPVPKPPPQSFEAGAAKFPGWDSRRYVSFQPKGRRATHYEDVTVDIQPDPDRYLLQNWILAFADGTPTYSERWSALRCTDWHKFRDPNQEWERSIYQRNSIVSKHLALTTSNAKEEGSYQRIDPTWLKVIERHLLASKHAEYWLGMEVFLMAQRDAMTNMINNALATNSADKLRYAQDLVLYGMDLAEMVEGFDKEVSKQVWLEDPTWAATRENVELITTSRDWGEQVFAANMVLEPLVLEPFRSGLVMRFAAVHGDFITPVIVGMAEWDYERHMRSSLELYTMLSDDPSHGPANRSVMRQWLARYVPLSVEAVKRLQPIWSLPRVKEMTFAEIYDYARDRFRAILGALHLELPEGVSL